MSTYLIVDSTARDAYLIINFGFIISPLLSDYFPSGINLSLSKRKIKTRPIELDRVSFYIRCTVINCFNN